VLIDVLTNPRASAVSQVPSSWVSSSPCSSGEPGCDCDAAAFALWILILLLQTTSLFMA
jgi:hypothetical protein